MLIAFGIVRNAFYGFTISPFFILKAQNMARGNFGGNSNQSNSKRLGITDKYERN